MMLSKSISFKIHFCSILFNYKKKSLKITLFLVDHITNWYYIRLLSFPAFIIEHASSDEAVADFHCKDGDTIKEGISSRWRLVICGRSFKCTLWTDFWLRCFRYLWFVQPLLGYLSKDKNGKNRVQQWTTSQVDYKQSKTPMTYNLCMNPRNFYRPYSWAGIREEVKDPGSKSKERR